MCRIGKIFCTLIFIQVLPYPLTNAWEMSCFGIHYGKKSQFWSIVLPQGHNSIKLKINYCMHRLWTFVEPHQDYWYPAPQYAQQFYCMKFNWLQLNIVNRRRGSEAGACAMGDSNKQTDMHAQFREVLVRVELERNLSLLQQLRASAADSSQAKNPAYTVLLPPIHTSRNTQTP